MTIKAVRRSGLSWILGKGSMLSAFPVGQWHAVVPLEKSVIFEAMDKPFEL